MTQFHVSEVEPITSTKGSILIGRT